MRMLTIGLAVLLLAATCDEDPLPPPKRSQPLGSRVELAAGDVWLTVPEPKQRLITGAMLPKTARLVVDQGARALIRTGNGTRVFVRHNSELQLDDEVVVLEKGELWADIPADEQQMGRFTAKNTTITAADAGLDIAIVGDEVRVYVARGLAVVASVGGRKEVESGEMAVVSKDKQPVVEPVSFWQDWTGGMADQSLQAAAAGQGSGRIYGIDRNRPGSEPQSLQISAQSVNVIIREGIAHTTVDQRFFNPSSTPLEGWYWFTIPEDAAVERFALDVNGQLIEGEMVERKQAARAYEAAVQKAVDPALLEWVDGRTFRARIFPIPAAGERRVVLSYTQLLPLSDGKYRYVYPMGGSKATRIQEFSLKVNLGDEGADYDIATLKDARIEQDNQLISMRRSGFVPRADFMLELTPKKEIPPLRAARFDSGRDEADYVMLRYSPQVKWASLKKVQGDVVVVLDTSAGGDESERQIRNDAVEAILRALFKGDRFAVVAADLHPRVVFPEQGLAEATEQNVAQAAEELAEVAFAGATDLGAMWNVALERLHDAQQPAVVYVGDGKATVGELSAAELAERLRRTLGDSRARFFTISIGADANHGLLERLARVGGGRSFRIDLAEQTVAEALRFVGQLKTPTITDLTIDAGSGLDQRFSSATGKVSKGEEVVVLARTHHELPEKITITGRLGDQPLNEKLDLDVQSGGEHGYLPTTWARQYLQRLIGDGLEENRGSIIALGLNYALMTPFSSFLVLESDQAYEEQGIQRRHRPSIWSQVDWRFGENSRLAQTVGAAPLLLFGCSEMSQEAPSPTSVASEEIAQTRSESASRPAPARQLAKPSAEMAEEVAPAAPPAEAKSLSDDAFGGGGLSSIGAPSTAKVGRGSSSERRASRPRPKRKLARKPMDRGPGKGSGQVLGTAGDGSLRDLLIAAGNPYGSQPKRRLFKKGICSDASRQPLSLRRILWQRRLHRVVQPADLGELFFDAGSHCELPRWRDQKVLLNLLERHARTPQLVTGLFLAFRDHPNLARYLRRQVLRRALDPDLPYWQWGGVNWLAISRGLAALKTPQAKLVELRKFLKDRPNDPKGRTLLVQLLLEAEMITEARAEASRLHRDGAAGPEVLRILCDLQAEAGLNDAAKRTCSELVEFNADDPAARRQLGDLFLRHGWYEAAYRQYRTLVEMVTDAPLALLRMAVAAAGIGKVDEALRIERKVSAGQGEPGPDDPRRLARLHSASRLARMLIEARAQNQEDKVKALERMLKRTQVAALPTTLKLLVWEDLEAPLDLKATIGQAPYPIVDRVSSPQTGMVMLELGQTVRDNLGLSVALVGASLRREVPYALITISWDGQKFTVEEQKGALPGRALQLAI